MNRREMMALLGGATVLPVAARAQRAVGVPSIGVIMTLTETDSEGQVRQAAFLKGLKETGYVDGQNVMIQCRWAAAQYDQLPVLTTDLVRRRVAVIVAPGSAPAALAVKAATKTIPIVYSTNGDPVKLGLVASLNRPGGNITGVS
jgi:putative tryptophan/tyrosine transport system substrate-binding protein